MSIKINKNLIVNQVDELNELNNEKIVVVTPTGELKQVDKSKVGGNISGFLPLSGTEINQPLTNTIKYNGTNPIIDNEKGTGIFYQNGLTKIYSQYNTSLAINYTGNGVINEMSVADSYTSLNAWRTTESGDYDYGSQAKVIADQVSILHNNNAGGMSSIKIKNNIDIVSWWNDATNSISLSGEENRISITNNSEDGSQVGGIYVINGNPKAIKGLSDEAFIATENSDLITKQYFDSNQALFVNTAGGYSHKYRKDNPTYYTGEVASYSIDLTFSSLETTTGINGDKSFGAGVNNIAHSTSSLILGYNSLTFAPYTGVFGGDGNMIGYGGDIDDLESTTQFAYIYGGKTNNIINGGTSSILGGTRNVIGSMMQTSGVWNSNSVIGGESNTIIMSEMSSIIGGNGNRIATNNPKTFDENSKNGYNTIIGGKSNSIVSSVMGTRPAYASVILGGENNSAQGYYNVVGGVGNYAVTLGETLFGIYGTQQAPFMSGFNRLQNARIFNVGVGTIEDPADGLSAFVSGLITAPSLTNELIDSETTGKTLITKEYFDANKGQQNEAGLVKNGAGYSNVYALNNPTLFAKIGGNAIHLSYHNQFVTNKEGVTGATGTGAVTFGSDTTASGSTSFACGIGTTANAMSSFACGSDNITNGNFSFACGVGNTTTIEGEMVVGAFSTNTTNRLFCVGIGTSNYTRKDGLVVNKNGLVTAPSTTNDLINNDTTGKVLVTKEYLNPNTLIKMITSANSEQINQIKSLLGI
ncbi:hypothetical protein [uncultured Empedobacter sp.]|uniref:hypothetical protein n=1 Tax=uncultured Empedobacter sp. TaxID=410844 RepID=UPI0025DB02BC|nr:hypothetical protein [uncultured Empedobacter sp.]